MRPVLLPQYVHGLAHWAINWSLDKLSDKPLRRAISLACESRLRSPLDSFQESHTAFYWRALT
jgi:hypothetical protein